MPTLAMEAHQSAMDTTVQEALQQAGIRADQLDAVAVSIGPGLSMCLKVPSSFLQQTVAAVHTRQSDSCFCHPCF